VTMLASAVAVPFVLLVPFLLHDFSGVTSALLYGGGLGVGGLGLLLQPDLAQFWYSSGSFDPHGFVQGVENLAPFMVGASVAAVLWQSFRAKAEPALVAALLFLCVYVFGVNFFLGYAVWALPFLVMAGGLRWVALVEIVWFVPVAFKYFRPELTDGDWSTTLVSAVYVPVMGLLWLAAAVALVMGLLRLHRNAEPAAGPAPV
jgi:hypothetical protein